MSMAFAAMMGPLDEIAQSDQGAQNEQGAQV